MQTHDRINRKIHVKLKNIVADMQLSFNKESSLKVELDILYKKFTMCLQVMKLSTPENINCRDTQGRNSTPLHLAGELFSFSTWALHVHVCILTDFW